VCDAFEEKAFENGIVTTPQTLLAEMFRVHHKKMDELITTRLAAIQQTAGSPTAAATVDKNQEPKLHKVLLMETLPQPLRSCTTATPTAVVFGTHHQVLLYHPE
jgi:hypothetical protein